MRMAIGLRPSPFAEPVGAHSAQVSRWERGDRPVPLAPVALLGAMVLDYVAGSSTSTAERLRRLKRGPERSAVTLDLTQFPNPWSTRAERRALADYVRKAGHEPDRAEIKRIQAQWDEPRQITLADRRQANRYMPVAAGKTSATTVKEFPAWMDSMIPTVVSPAAFEKVLEMIKHPRKPNKAIRDLVARTARARQSGQIREGAEERQETMTNRTNQADRVPRAWVRGLNQREAKE
jgi:hypothetical protein